jgi:parvulin-like peptidyl-prolyl isomerase
VFLCCSILIGLLSGCEPESSTSRVATVRGVAIGESRLAQWVGAFALPGIAEAIDGSGTFSVDDCVAARRRLEQRAAEVHKGSSTSGQKAASRCEVDFAAARRSAIGYLIRSEWIERESRRRGLEVNAHELERATSERTERFAGRRSFRRYLARSGMTANQFRHRVKRDALARKLMVVIASPDLSVSRADISRFYRRHYAQFKRPATRELRIVVTRSRDEARRARMALARGRRWSAVVREFTVDASKRLGGRVRIDTTNTIPELRRAVFSTPIGRLRGPFEVRGSWWIFRVDRELPARQLSVSESTLRIRTSIRSTREQLAFDRLTAYLTRRYRPHTVCHDGYWAPECRNRRMRPSAAPAGGR